MNKRALKAVARLTHVDLRSAVATTRTNPLLESEITIEEELINLKESIDSYYTAGSSIHQYPQIYQHISQEKRDILKHCIGLTVRMLLGKRLPRPYSREDVDFAVRRLVQLIVREARLAGKRLDIEMIEIFRPYLTMRQRVALRDFTIDSVMQSTSMQRAQTFVGRLPLGRAR